MWKYLILLAMWCLCRLQEDGVSAQDNSLSPQQIANQRELVYLQILTTDGFYAPLSLYPNDENTEEDWIEGLGMLPKLGKLQHYEFGKSLRRYYSHFITANPAEVDSFSSCEDRSTLSLLTFLAALYAPTEEWQFCPGFRWQPIALNYMDNDDIFFSYEDPCPRQQNETEYVHKTPVAKELYKKDKFLYSFWSNNSGAIVENWRDVANLYDTIHKEERYGLKVPKWARMYLDDMKRITDYAYTWSYQTPTQLQLKVGALIDLLTVRMRVLNMEENPTPDVKVSVYLTHDWNLATLLNAMRLPNGLRPPPCATLSFEMYRQGEEKSVRTLFFNGTHPEKGEDQEPHLLVLDGCSEYCPLGTFVSFFSDVIPEDYRELCGPIVSTSPPEDDSEEIPDIYPMYYDLKEIANTAPP